MKTKTFFGLMAFVCLAVLNFTEGANNFGLGQALASTSSSTSSSWWNWSTSSGTTHFVVTDEPCCNTSLQTEWNTNPCQQGTRNEPQTLYCPVPSDQTQESTTTTTTTTTTYPAPEITIGVEDIDVTIPIGQTTTITTTTETTISTTPGYKEIHTFDVLCTRYGGKCNVCKDFIADCTNYKNCPVKG